MAKYWVLKDGRQYFKTWTGIGPAATRRKNEAQRFQTKRDAMNSPAFTFVLTSYEPVEVG